MHQAPQTPPALRDQVKAPDSLIPQEPLFTAKGPGTAKVRVLRSASLKLQQQERAALPMDWTAGENNHPDMNKILLTQVPTEGLNYAHALNNDATEQAG